MSNDEDITMNSIIDKLDAAIKFYEGVKVDAFTEVQKLEAQLKFQYGKIKAVDNDLKRLQLARNGMVSE